MSPLELFLTAAEMTAFPIPATNNRISATLAGVASVNDKLGGLFVFDETSVAVVDGVNVFAPDVGSGRWLRILVNAAAPQQKQFTVAASIWTWTHNLGRKLAGIQAFDSSWNLIATDIQENTDNQITVTHLANITGWLMGS